METERDDMNRVEEIINEVKKAVSGKDQVLLWMLTAILAKGHILLEDIPGVGKTTIALAFAKALDLSYGRVQFTPDVLPSDITGYSVYDKETGEMTYRPGAVLCNLFLADELNRATSRTQSALLEAMEEGQVTVDGVSHPVPQPFFVVATQNPTGAAGTQLLPDSQIDRFTIRLTVGYPDEAAECDMVRQRMDGNPLERYRVATADEDLTELRRPQVLEGVYGPGPGSFLRLTEEEYRRLQDWSDAAEPKHLAPDVHNPVFPGLHADPEVLYSEKTGRYYIYPTTDGAFGWHNHDFKCFSSSDLVHWKDEGVILDLQDLEWGKEYAWAPCIIERDGRYYYYFVANKSVGVAVSDRPEGPFRDALGGPLLSQEAIGSPNQVIDPDVFRDPATGKYYLYWGNSYLWMAELADDMVSLVPGTMHELIPRSRIGDYHYLEGTYVFERGGLYYFMWSENITRSARYRIRYLISDSPTEFVRNGQPARVEETIILQQDPSLQIFGTGHNSVICKPGTDEWYMVYHRFTRPEGIKMGLSGGYNREVCIDRMYFNEDGTIVPVKVTL